jgi:hypothetical protein
MNLKKGIFVLATLAAAAWLLWLFDDGLETGWPPMVIGNWQEFGLFNLHGALVTNPGGFDVAAHPDIYYGMSPWYLYPVYICTELFVWTGLGALPYHILLAALVVWGIWSLMGKNNVALMVAALVIVSPGYGRWQKTLDPNAISVLLGFPYAAVVTSALKKARLGLSDYLAILVLTAMFVPLNWTTAWFLTPFGVFLLLQPEVRRRPALVYLTLTALATLAFVGYSMLAKHTGAAPAGAVKATMAQPPAAHSFLGGYTWGAYGYYEGLSSFRFFARLFSVNLLGSLPLILWWFIETVRCVRKTPRIGWLSMLPFLVAVLELAAMRNYFCHHPWMGAPVVITGLVFSLALQFRRDETRKAFDTLFCPATATAVAFGFGLVVIMGLRTNNGDGLLLRHLIRSDVPRSETVVIIRAIDPSTASLAGSLSVDLDRHVVVVDSLADVPSNLPFSVLSSVPADDMRLVGESGGAAKTGPLDQAIAWFNKNIARRKTNDKIQYAAHYYLYRPVPGPSAMH